MKRILFCLTLIFAFSLQVSAMSLLGIKTDFRLISAGTNMLDDENYILSVQVVDDDFLVAEEDLGDEGQMFNADGEIDLEDDFDDEGDFDEDDYDDEDDYNPERPGQIDSDASGSQLDDGDIDDEFEDDFHDEPEDYGKPSQEDSVEKTIDEML